MVTECLWADPDGRRLKKGNTLYFGYKGFWRSDGAGHVEVVPVRPANAGEAPHLPHLLKGCAAVRVLADKACSSETNGAVLARQGLKSGDHVPGGTEPSARRLAEEVQPSGGEATLDHRAKFWNAQGSLPWGACPLHHAGESRGGVDPQGRGYELAQGGQPH